MAEPTPQELLALARTAADQAGAFLLQARPGLDLTRDVAAKSTPTDVVTRLDLEAERIVAGMLLGARPDDRMVGEEQGERPGEVGGASSVRWVVDPLDGTVNYLYGVPTWAVSIAAQVGGQTVAGVVSSPPLGRTYWAVAGGGSFRDGVPLRASQQPDLALALVATGFAYDAALRARQGEAVGRLLGRVRDVRRLGSAALDLCLLAEGAVDAYFERGLNEWDLAAGRLIAAEAGACVEVHDGLALGAGPSLIDPFRRLLRDVAA